MAFFKGSYYQNLPHFEGDEGEDAPFRGVRARSIADPEPILEHAVAIGDRLDSLGQHYYSNPRDWRRLADCNPDYLFAEDLLLRPAADDKSEGPIERTGEALLVPRRREGQR